MSQGVSKFFLYTLRPQQAFRPTAAGVMSRPGQAEPKMEADLAASVPLKAISNTGIGKAFVTHRGASHEQARPGGAQNGSRAGDAPASLLYLTATGADAGLTAAPVMSRPGQADPRMEAEPAMRPPRVLSGLTTMAVAP